MIDQLGIIILHSYESSPVSCVIDIPIILCLNLLQVYLLLPSIFHQLILHICLNIVSPILNLLMNMAISVMADHVDIQSIVGVFIPETKLSEVLLVLGLRVAEPIGHSVVYGYAVALAEMEEEMWLVHTEIKELSLIGLYGHHEYHCHDHEKKGLVLHDVFKYYINNTR